MKKHIGILLLIMVLLLTGCGKQASESAPTAALETPAPAAPTPAEPESEPGTVLIPHLGAVLGTLPLGEQVTIVSMEDKYYLADTSVGQGFIEKRLLRLEGEPEFEGFTAYAKPDALLYKGYRMLGDGGVLDTNTKLTVLQAFDGGFMVKLNDETGYVAGDMLSETPVSTGSSSGGGGGSSGGANDGGDISLTSAAVSGGHVRLLADSSLATVIVDEAEVYAAFFKLDDTVKVTNATDELCTIYLDGKLLSVPRCFVALEGDASYESRTAYARWNAAVYEDYTMAGDAIMEPEANRKITVLGEFGRCCLVDVDGTMGFMSPNYFGDQPIYPSSGGGGGGAAEKWTPPAL